MGKTVVTSADFHKSFLAVRDKLSARAVDLDIKHYVVVPDKCSLHAERTLFRQGTGAFDAEVLTFNRLYIRFARSAEEFLPRSGAVMLVRKIVGDIKNEFRVFKSSAGLKGFAGKLYDAITAAAEAGLAPQDLKGEGAAGLKLSDIALAYARYLQETDGKFVDLAGRMRLLLRDIAAADLSDAHFYVAGFDYFTRRERDILAVLESNAASYTHYAVLKPEYAFGEAEFYEASGWAERIKAAAKRIRRAVVTDGARYRDFCVLSPAAGYAPLERVFKEFDIPFYIDKKLNLRDTELFRFLELSESAAGAWRRQDIIALSKNYYAGVDKREADIFENYCLARAVNYKRFSEPFAGEGGEAAAAEAVRRKLAGFLAEFRQKFCAAATPEKFCAFLNEVFELSGAAEKTAELSEAAGADLNQIYEELLNTAEFLKNAAPGGAKPGQLFALFAEGAGAVEISLMSEASDAVTVGGAETFRAGRFRQAFAVDFCAGGFPEVREGSGSLVTDADAAVLAARGVEFARPPAELNACLKDEAARVLASADKLFLAYSEADGNRISDLARAVERGAKSVAWNSAERERGRLYDESAYREALLHNDAAYLSELAAEISSKSNALELLAGSLADVRAQRQALPFLAELRAAGAGAEKRYLQGAAAGEKPVLPEAGALFFKASDVSVSRAEEYFDCPYKSFVSSGLRLKERDTGDIKPVDIGRFLHRAAERFVAQCAGTGFSDAESRMRAAASEIAQEEFGAHFEKNRPLFGRVIDEAVRLSGGIARSFTSGAFKNLGVEMRFGHTRRNDLKTITFEVEGGGKITLRGTIDRVDVFGSYARVVDYKTGKPPKFSYADLYYGRLLQLPVYLKVLEENGYQAAGMFYFPLAARWGGDAENAQRFSGVFNAREELALAADRRLSEPGYKSNVLEAERNKTAGRDGAPPPLKKTRYALDTQGLSALADYSVRALANALSEIHEGYIAAAPCEDACKYCLYGAICGFDSGRGRVRLFYNAQRTTHNAQ